MKRIVVPVSGGKDSQTVLSLAVKEHGSAAVTAVHHDTGYDHPVTYEHMQWMEGFYGVKIVRTKSKYSDVFDLIERRQMIPGRQARLCTDEFKIAPFNRWLKRQRRPLSDITVLMGMRGPESRNRMESYGGLSPDDEFSLSDLFPKKTPKYLSAVRVRLPIVDKTDQWVFSYLSRNGERINPLYARGHRRVGCYPCLLASDRDFRLAARDPVGRERIVRLDQLRTKIFAANGIKETDKIYGAVLDGRDLKALLDREDPANPNNDPFGIWSGRDIDDEPDEDPGCGMCAY